MSFPAEVADSQNNYWPLAGWTLVLPLELALPMLISSCRLTQMPRAPSSYRSRSELPTTSKLLQAIATAAMTGLMMPKTASGRATRL